MNQLVVHPGTAHDLLQVTLITWAVIEFMLQLRSLRGRTAADASRTRRLVPGLW